MKLKNINSIFPLKTFLLIGLTLFYLLFQTGFHGDDYSVMNQWNLINFLKLTPENLGLKIFGIPDFLTFWWAYPVLGYEYPWLFDVIKIFTHLLSILLACHFFSLFFNLNRSLFASLLFVLLPLHDATTYWYMVAAYIFWPSVIMFSFYLISINKIKLGAIVATIGAFSFYLSPPYVFGLGLIFFIKREYRKGWVFITPGILYIIYYFCIKNIYPFVEKRINKDLDVLMFSKGIVLQAMGIIDSFIGPSAFIKIYYSSISIGLLSLFFALVILVTSFFCIGKISAEKNFVNIRVQFLRRELIVGAVFVLFLSIAMFALTGLYVPSPFNLGNRSLVYGSFLVSVLLASLDINRKNILFGWLIFVLPVFGISDHWKEWNVKQLNILNNIQNNHILKNFNKSDVLIVTGNAYDKLGPFSHIEFFNMPWVVGSIFKDFAGIENALPLTQTISIEGNYLTDSKYGNKFLITGSLYIYDSDKNIVSYINKEEIQKMIDERPKETRHWIQLFKGTFIQKTVVVLSPRLGYLFDN